MDVSTKSQEKTVAGKLKFYGTDANVTASGLSLAVCSTSNNLMTYSCKNIFIGYMYKIHMSE